jgi:nucleoside-diphosphate-sugar epimerase
MKILAVGATGFIGPWVIRRLAAEGYEIAVLHRGETAAAFPTAVHRIIGDRNRLSSVRKAIEQFRPDTVLDVIPYTDNQVLELLDAVRSSARRLIVLSSGDVYRNYGALRRSEEHELDPAELSEEAPLRRELYPYRSASAPAFPGKETYEKILVERAALGDSSVRGTVPRLPAVFGPGDRFHRLRPWLRRMDDQRPAILMNLQQATFRWTRGYVENVAAAIAVALLDERASGRIFNVGKRDARTEAEWVRELGRAAGWSGSAIALPDDRLPAHLKTSFDWRYHLAMDTRRIRDELGFEEPVSEGEALVRTIEWERATHVEGDDGELDYASEDAALVAAAR